MTGENVCALTGWALAEGGHFTPGGARFNPLNTSQPAPGSTIFNSVGVRNYPDWSVGLSATITTLNLGYYTAIRAALTAGTNPVGMLVAVDASPWGTKSKNPASWLKGECQSLAAEFNARRAPIQARIDDANQAITQAQAKHDSVLAEQVRLGTLHQQMAGEIAAAQQHLDRFAYDLYIAGLDPSIATEVETVTSVDPIAHLQAQLSVDRAGDNGATAIQRALDLLAEVGASQQAATAAVAASNSALGHRQQVLIRAEQQMTALEQQAFVP